MNYMSQILVELITKLANLIITITKALACANRISAVLETPASMTAPAAESWAGSLSPVKGTVRICPCRPDL